jgi:transcriptional regulator with XRE-family HTH domain
MVGATIDVAAVYAALDRKRRQVGFNWLARGTGVSPSTFTRMAQGHRPDVDTFVTLCSWLGVPAEVFTRGEPVEKGEGNTLAIISANLRASPHLSPESARAIEDIVSAAYERLKDR